MPDDRPELSAHWQITSERLETTYLFATFGDAIRFMAACVEDIDRMDHHPDWSNAHRRVHVVLSTHTADGVTHKDYELAAVLDGIYARSKR